MSKRWGILWVMMVPAAAWCAERGDLLVSTEWLAGRLGDPSLVILHTGSQKDYAAGHIPGARLVRLADISVTGESGLRLELPPVESLREAFGRMGVSDTSRVIVCAGDDSIQSATRVWFTLDYLGLGERTSLLDGGLAAWRAEGRPLSTATPSVNSAVFTARPRPNAVVDAEWLRSRLGDGDVTLLDARTPEFYSGANQGSMLRAGHIPGARNIPYNTLWKADGKWKPAAALKEMLGAPKGVVAYCHIGQQATVLYFAARYLGWEARLYDGSFQDWSSRGELPVKTAP